METQALTAETQGESSDYSDCTSSSRMSDFSVLCSAETCSSRAGDSDAGEVISSLRDNTPTTLDSPIQFSNSELGKAAFEFSLAAFEFLRSMDNYDALFSSSWDSATSRNKSRAAENGQARRPAAMLHKAASFAADANPCKPVEPCPENATTSCSDIAEVCLADEANTFSSKRGREFAGQPNPRSIKLVRTTE